MGDDQTAAVYQRIPNFSHSTPYTVTLTCIINNGGQTADDIQAQYGRQWSVFVRLHNTSPNASTNGIRAYIKQGATAEALPSGGIGYRSYLVVEETVASSTTTRTLEILNLNNRSTLDLIVVVNGTSVQVGCLGASGVGVINFTTSLAAGTYDRVGFACGNTSIIYVDQGIQTRAGQFKLSGTLLAPASSDATGVVRGTAFRKPILCAIAGGRLYREKTPGVLDPFGTETGVVASGSATTAVLASTTLTNTSLTGYILDFLNLFSGRSRRIDSYVTGTQTATFATMSDPTGDTYRVRPIGTTQYGPVLSATSTTITLDDTAVTRLNLATWKIQIVAGTGLGQVRTASSHNAGTQTMTISTGATDWNPTPDATSRYRIFPGFPAVSFRTDGVPLMAVELRGKLYVADWEEPRFVATNAVANDDDITHTGVTGVPNVSFLTYMIDSANDLIVVTDATGTASNGNYAVSGVADTVLTATTDIESATTNCAVNVRVQRAPKVYDPIAETLTLITSTAGQVPVGCPMVARYRDRLVWAGFPPQIWYMSRQGNARDYDYGDTDDQAAVAGVAGNAGVIPDPLTSIINCNDDYFTFGCEQSLFVMRGDPRGGSLTQLSNSVGILDRMSVCHTPDGFVPFLSREGLYRIVPGAGGVEPLSKRKIPKELVRIDKSKYWVTMAYDGVDQGVHIYITPYTSTETARHWWFDWTDGTYWPVQVPSGMDPFAVLSHDIQGDESAVVLAGCRDGYVRRYDDNQVDDDGEDLNSYAMIGPIRTNRNDQEGVIRQMIGTLAEGSADVNWSMYLGRTPETAIRGSAWPNGLWVEGLNYNDAIRARGASVFLKLASTGRWAFERASVAVKPGGPVRKA